LPSPATIFVSAITSKQLKAVLEQNFNPPTLAGQLQMS